MVRSKMRLIRHLESKMVSAGVGGFFYFNDEPNRMYITLTAFDTFSYSKNGLQFTIAFNGITFNDQFIPFVNFKSINIGDFRIFPTTFNGATTVAFKVV